MRKPLLWHALANVGPYASVPPIVVGLLLPAGLLLARASVDPRLTTIYIDFSTRLLIPALAAWWPPFVFKERIEGEGRELLYLLKRNGEGVTALALAVLYAILLVPFVLVARGVPGFLVESVPLLFARCLFVTSFAFGAAFILGSSALGFILAFLLDMVATTPLEGFIESSGFSLTFGIGDGVRVPTVLSYVALSAVLLWIGEVKSRRFA